jgi:dolichyl-diphosphooligosaccharide--protein glycosyltransferase
MVTTLDAYKWVRMGEEHKEGVFDSKEKDYKMYYPDGRNRPNPVPMLSVILAKVSSFFGGNLYEAGLFLIPIFAGLFMLPLAAYCYIIGYQLMGLLGGFVGTFSTMYYIRTTAGRIDTDSLNTFFMFLTALLILIAQERKKEWQVWLGAAFAGFSQLLFYWWYHHSSFILVFWVVFIAGLLLNKHKLKTVAVAAGVYVLFSNPIYFMSSIANITQLLSSYVFSPEVRIGGFPNVYQTVTEAKGDQVLELLTTTFIHPIAIFFALASLILMAVRNFKRALPMAPVIAVGFLVIVSSGRFIMYLTPFLGAGIGYLLGFAADKLPVKQSWIKLAASYAAGATFIALVYLIPNVNGFIFRYTPPPSIDTNMYSTFNMLKEQLPADSAVYTWWDFGLAIEAQSGLATFHDGMSQNTIKTWHIARSLLSEPKAMASQIAYIANNGMNGINDMLASGASSTDIVKTIDAYDEPLERKNVYLSFTQDMIMKFGAIEHIGAWDVASGTPSNATGIDSFYCNPSAATNITCGQIKIDLGIGMINTSIPLHTIAYVNARNGKFISEKRTDFDSALSLVMLQDNGVNVMGFVMNSRTYNSGFVQLYLMGKYDETLYREVINVYPLTRVFQVLK